MRILRAAEHRCCEITALATLALLLLLSGWQVDARAQQWGDQSSGTISGTVLNNVTHEPIGRALVYSADERYAVLTDDHGHFELSIPPDVVAGHVMGQTQLQVKKPGFLSDKGPWVGTLIVPGQKEVTLSLIPEGLIVGRVKFPTTDTANRVQVQLYRREVREGIGRWVPMPPVGTRSDGEFRFAGLAAGEYKLFTLESVEQDPLTAVPNGPVYAFPPRYFAAARDLATADAIPLRAGENVTANLAPERQRYYDVKVPVAGSEPGPPTGKEVAVFPQGHRGPGFELGYDPSQGAVVGALPNGSYTVEVSSSEPNPATGIANIIVANAPVHSAAIALVANPSIEINVRQDLTGAENSRVAQTPFVSLALQSADEYADDRGYQMSSQSPSAPPVLAGVKPGRYWVQVQMLGGEGYVASVSSGGRDLFRAPLVVPIGASIPPIEITVRYGTAEIEAAVDRTPDGLAAARTGDANNPVAFATSAQPGRPLAVYCLPLSNPGGQPIVFYSQPDGSYTAQHLPPGDYRILAFDVQQQLEYRNPAAMRAYESKGQVVHLAPGEKARVKLQVIQSE